MNELVEESQSKKISEKIIPTPSSEAILSQHVDFPFKPYEIWTEAFNHMRVVKGEEVQVLEKQGKYALTLPEQPTLLQIIEAVKMFVQEAGIEIKDKRFEDFTRAIRNTARLILRYTPDEKRERIQPLIDSIYALGSELHQAFFDSTPLSLREHPEYELPQEADKEDYENDLFLRLLGKGSVYFDKQDKKLSQVGEHSAYYSLFDRFRQRQIKQNPDFQSKSYKEQMDLFDQWLIERKKIIINSLLPYFYQVKKERQNEQTSDIEEVVLISSLQKGGRTHYALVENITRQVFQFLDEAVEEEGGKKIEEKNKETLPSTSKASFFGLGKSVQIMLRKIFPQELRSSTLTSPPLFIDLGEDLQKMLKEIFPQESDKLSFDVSRFEIEDTQRLVQEIKRQVGETEYGKMSLFELAGKVLQKAQEERERNQQPLTTYEKLTLLLDLVQAYEYAETIKLTKATETLAFECNLRSYILGRLCREFLGNEVDVYVVFPTGHTLLMIVDKSKEPQKAYWVDPTGKRYYYGKGRRKKRWGEKLAIEPLKEDDWLTIQKGIQANPDNFSLYGEYQMFGRKEFEFATILPFEGIKAGFLFNLGWIKYNEASKLPQNTKKRRQLLQQAFFYYKKAFEINLNHPDFYNNLSAIYADKDFAYDEKGEFDIDKYISNINQAFLEMYRAYRLDQTPNRIDKFLWVIKRVLDEDAKAVYQGLSRETKEIIWQMYQRYQEDPSFFTEEILGRKPFSFGFENSPLFQLIKKEFEEKQLDN